MTAPERAVVVPGAGVIAATEGPSRIAVPVAVLLCSYSIALETTVVSAAIPKVIQGFGGLSELSWVFSTYLIAQAVTMPLFGTASDRLGRKSCYAVASALFFVGTLACGLAWNMPSLIVFRVLQGIGGGGMITVGTAALNDVIPHTSRGKYQAMGSAVWGLAAVSGPVVGSVIMELLDWRYIFWVNLPIVLVSALLVTLFYRGRASTGWTGKLALLPSLYMCVSLLAVMAALVHGARFSAVQWGVCATAGGAATVLLIAAQGHSADPLIPTPLLRMKIVVLAVFSAFLCGAISMGVTVYMPSFATVVLRSDYLTISSTVGVMTFTWTLSVIAIGVLIESVHYRRMANFGGWAVVIGSLGLCHAAKNPHGIELVMIHAGLLGLGLGACSVVFSVAVQCAVSDDMRGSATSLFYLSRMFGQSIGVALCAGVLASSDSLVRAVMNQPGAADSPDGRKAMAEAAVMAGSIRSEFVEAFGVIAVLALVQLGISIYTPKHLAAEE